MSVAVSFRFFPTEEELVSFYLRNQLEGMRREMHLVIPVVNVYDVEPWDLPKLAGELCKGDTEQWFYFTPTQEKEARGGRPTRTTPSGYWKAAGSPGYVYSWDDQVIATKKTMVFYKGKAPCGRKTKWKMNEYRAIDPSSATTPKLRDEFILCRVYVVTGSSRIAFERRPVEPLNNVATTSKTRATVMMEITSSSSSSSASGTSHAGCDHYNPAEVGEDDIWEFVKYLQPTAPIGLEQTN